MIKIDIKDFENDPEKYQKMVSEYVDNNYYIKVVRDKNGVITHLLIMAENEC